jgi:hypothetical protein
MNRFIHFINSRADTIENVAIGCGTIILLALLAAIVLA